MTAGHAQPVGIARAPAAAFTIKHQRHAPLLGKAKHAVDLLVIHMTLRAGQYGVVVSDHHTARVVRAELVRINSGNARNQSIGGCTLDQIIEFAPTTLRRDRQRSVFDERAFID
jgi:hypothetical protein